MYSKEAHKLFIVTRNKTHNAKERMNVFQAKTLVYVRMGASPIFKKSRREHISENETDNLFMLDERGADTV